MAKCDFGNFLWWRLLVGKDYTYYRILEMGLRSVHRYCYRLMIMECELKHEAAYSFAKFIDLLTPFRSKKVLGSTPGPGDRRIRLNEFRHSFGQFNHAISKRLESY
jgi:hypothetical protein